MIKIYTKDNCPYCDMAKTLLTNKGIEFEAVKIGADITREAFMKTFPEVRSVPLAVVEEAETVVEHIGGFKELKIRYDGGE